MSLQDGMVFSFPQCFCNLTVPGYTNRRACWQPEESRWISCFFLKKKKKKNVAIRHSASLLLDEVWQKEPSSKSQTSIFFLADIGAMQIFSRSQSFKSNKWRNNTVIVIKSCCFCSNFILSCQILIDFMLQQKRNQILHILILANRYNYYYQTYLCLHHSSCWSPHPLRHRPL